MILSSAMQRVLLSALVAVTLVACGGGSSPTAPSAPQPFNQTLAGTVSVFGTTVHPLTTSRAGTMTIRLQWGTGADLDLYLSNPACVSLYPLAGCGILAAANGLANPESVVRTVASSESFRVWVDNLSLTQSVNYTLSISIN